jgi:hypothetical protein
MRTGWTFTRSARNNAHVHILAALTLAVETIPFEVTGLDFDNGGEFINYDVIDWAARPPHPVPSGPARRDRQARNTGPRSQPHDTTARYQARRHTPQSELN